MTRSPVRSTLLPLVLLPLVLTWLLAPLFGIHMSPIALADRPRTAPAAAVLAVIASDCTLYASPSGSATNSGTSPSNPLTLKAASSKAVPGSVVCLLAGTYNLTAPLYLSKGGTASAYIKYTSYDSANQAVIRWSGSAQDDMFQINNNAAYLEFNSLKFIGNDVATRGIYCSRGSHHIRIIRNTINRAGVTGIAAIGCDYVTVDGNMVHRSGYGKGWGSGISLHGMVWHNQAAGFHSFVVNNIISGSYDGSSNHSDGNGIIMDDGETAATPPVLIANNLVYMNGGRCIHIYLNHSKWVINNTCYANSLDGEIGGGTGSVGEYSTLDASKVYFINNVVKAWTKGYPFLQYNSSEIKYYRNTYYGGKGLRGISSTVANDPAQLREVAPQFVDPIKLDPTADGQYRNALHPNQVGNRFTLQADSPLINAGIDPRTVPGMTAEIKAGIEQYVLKDLQGTARPQGSGFDIGAYEYRP